METKRIPTRPPAKEVTETIAPYPPAGRLPELLIVEDHADSATVLARLLRQNGYMVQLASTIQQALSLVAQHRFDIVLTDLHLPDGHGRDLMSALHSRDRIPGIAMTGDVRCDAGEMRAQGFAYTLTKPLNVADLLSAVQKVLVAFS